MKKLPGKVGDGRGDRHKVASGSAAVRPSLRGYVNWKPSTSEVDRLVEFEENVVQVEALIARVLDSGWGITLKSDQKPGTYIVSVSTWRSGHPSAGCILNTRGKDRNRLVPAICWALEVLFDYSLEEHVGVTESESPF